MYRNDLSVEQLLTSINYVKDHINDIPVGYVDAYYEFSVHQQITEACDVILSNCYPFWEGTIFEHSVNHMQEMYKQTRNASGGKKVIITETGWPSHGEIQKRLFLL